MGNIESTWSEPMYITSILTFKTYTHYFLQTYQTSEAVENFLYNNASGAIHFSGSGVSPAIL